MFWKRKDKEVSVKDGITEEERRVQRRWQIRLITALVVPVFLETLDYTVVATAQPHIASAFDRLDLQSYIGTVYLLTSTVFLPLFASFADVYGRHWSMQFSLLLFLAGSALSTAAQNMPMMLAGRGISGVGAAGLLTVVRIILADGNSLNDNNFQSSMLAYLYSIGYSVGPVLGGVLVNISFRWVFAINLPCCVVSMVLVFVLLRAHTMRPRLAESLSTSGKLLAIDWIGATLFIGGGVALLLGLNWGSSETWNSAKVILSIVLGALSIALTIGWEAILEHKQKPPAGYVREDNESADELDGQRRDFTREHVGVLFRSSAMLPLSVLSNYDVMATSFAAFTSGMVMLVIFYFVAIFFVIVAGHNAVDAGIQLIYFAPGMGVGTMLAILMVKHVRQPKYPIILGGTLLPIALGLISQAIDRSQEGAVDGFMVMAGIGVGLTFGPLSIHARFSQPSDRVAVVVALNLFFRSLGGTIGLAQCGTIVNARVRSFFEHIPASAVADLQSSNGTLTSFTSISSLPQSVQDLVKDAFRDGVRWAFVSLIPWACLSLVGCLFLGKIANSDRVESLPRISRCSCKHRLPLR